MAAAPFTDLPSLLEWLTKLDPVDQIRVTSLLADNTTQAEMARHAGRTTFGLVTSGGGQLRLAQLADLLGVSVAAVKRRVHQYRQANGLVGTRHGDEAKP